MDYEIELRYQKLNKHLEKTFGDDLDVHALLFLIGVNELGKGHNKYSKQEKTDLIHIAICTLLALRDIMNIRVEMKMDGLTLNVEEFAAD